MPQSPSVRPGWLADWLCKDEEKSSYKAHRHLSISLLNNFVPLVDAPYVRTFLNKIVKSLPQPEVHSAIKKRRTRLFMVGFLSTKLELSRGYEICTRVFVMSVPIAVPSVSRVVVQGRPVFGFIFGLCRNYVQIVCPYYFSCSI